MRTFAIVALVFAAAAPAVAGPLPVLSVPRLDADGIVLPPDAVRRLGSGTYLTGYVSDLALSADCGIAYAGRNAVNGAGGLAAWDTATGKPLWESLPRMNVAKVALSADGKTVWAVGFKLDKDKYVAEVASARAADGAPLSRQTVHNEYPNSIHVAETGRVAIQSQNGVAVYDPDRADAVFKTAAAQNGQTGAVLSRDGRRVVVTGQTVDFQNQLKLTAYDVETGKEAWTSAVAGFAQIMPHPDGKRVWAMSDVAAEVGEAGGAKVFQTWDIATGTATSKRIVGAANLNAPQFRPGGKSAVGYDSGFVTEYELPTWKPKRRWADIPVNSRYWLSEDGTTVAVVNGTLALFDVDTGKRTAGRVAQYEYATEVRFADDRVVMRRGARDITYDLATGRELKSEATPRAGGVARSADGETVVVQRDGKLIVRKGERERPLADSGGHGQTGTTMTPDGKFVIAGRNNVFTVRVWDAATGEKKHDLEFENPGGNAYPNNGVRCSPDNRHVAVHETNGTQENGKAKWSVSVWDLTTGRQVRRFTGSGYTFIQYVTWAGDGRTLLVHGTGVPTKAGTNPGFVVACDVKSTAEPVVRTLAAMPTAAAVTRNGKAMAFTIGRTVEVWDTAGTALRRTLRTPSFGVYALAFTQDGRELVADGPDGTFVYPLPDLTRPPLAPRPRMVRE